MAYIGKQPIVGNFVKLDAITTSATATYNLLNGGVAYYPQSANNCIVSLNGVIQSPTSAYTISGSTIVFSDALTSSDTIDFILVLGDVLSIGTPSDGTITSAKLASGVSGLISWQSVQTSGFTAVAGRGYPCNTTSAAFTVTLPSSATAGDTIILVDYAGTFGTNKLTLGANGLKINGSTLNKSLTTNRESVILTYVDATQGWVSTSGSNEGTKSLDTLPYTVDFLIIAGGAGGGWVPNNYLGSGGGGAGGYRNSYSTETSGGGGSSETELTLSGGTVYTITVGAGGAGGTDITLLGSNGSNSVISGSDISTITSTGGGGGNGGDSTRNGANGGSGGGSAGGGVSGGSGTANQGYAGGSSSGTAPAKGGGGGGGASAVGGNGSTSLGGAGGAGLASSITGSSVTRAGGGGGGTINNTSGAGGAGGGGTGGYNATGGTGTANTGSGGGGTGSNSATGYYGGAGGSGVVILRMLTDNYSGVTTGSPTVTTSGTDTILVYNSSGTYTG